MEGFTGGPWETFRWNQRWHPTTRNFQPDINLSRGDVECSGHILKDNCQKSPGTHAVDQDTPASKVHQNRKPKSFYEKVMTLQNTPNFIGCILFVTTRSSTVYLL